MELFTSKQLETLYANGLPEAHNNDHKPEVYLIEPKSRSQWLVTELFLGNNETAFGLYQEENQKPKFGMFSLNTIYDFMQNGIPILNQIGFQSNFPISTYRKVADDFGNILANEKNFAAEFTVAEALLRPNK